jgi:hypothetical protein
MSPWQKIRDLEAALRHERQRVDAEQRRADVAEASARRAWQFSTWRGPRHSSPGFTRTDDRDSDQR